MRDLEHRLQVSQGWETKPKPVVHVPVPVDPANPSAYLEKVKLMYDLARLAFQTDSTRSITLMLDSAATPAVDGITEVAITEGYHNLSHHGKVAGEAGAAPGLGPRRTCTCWATCSPT